MILNPAAQAAGVLQNPTNLPFTPKEWQTVESSNLAAIWYDPATLELKIRFNDGSSYSYDNVPQDRIEQLYAAESKGSYFSRNIRKTYSFHKLT